MKINLNKIEMQKIIALLSVRETNMNVSTMYMYYLMNESCSINKNMIDFYMKRKHTLEMAFYHCFVDVLELDYDDYELKQIEKLNRINEIKKLDTKKYINNPYYKNIKVPQIKEGKWYFKYDSFLPYEGFIYKDVIVDENNNFAEYTSLGFFNEPFKYLTLTQDNEIWMSITPHEIETMEQSIKEASGKVVVFGLGLGYYPYMISLKENVEKITIVEINNDAIKLFKQYILPQFEHKKKIEIISSDAFVFAEKMAQNHFNYAFVDLWHNVEDGLELYLKMKAIEKNFSHTKFSYWIEDALLVMLRRCLLTLIDEEADGATDEHYQIEENYDDHVINRLHFILKDKEINTYSSLENMLKKEYLTTLAKKIESK